MCTHLWSALRRKLGNAPLALLTCLAVNVFLNPLFVVKTVYGLILWLFQMMMLGWLLWQEWHRRDRELESPGGNEEEEEEDTTEQRTDLNPVLPPSFPQ